MKRTYIAPTLVVAGVVEQTLSGPVFGNEIAQPLTKRPLQS
jgi:hypothetical protein